jgi:enterobactin synthetase component D
MNTPLPHCISPLQQHWPLPLGLPGAVLVSSQFEPALLAPGDFVLSGIEPPASIQRSVAKRQAEFLAGRVCARAALLALDGLARVPEIGEDRAPVWPGHISGSITHGSGWAAAVVAHKAQWRGLGLDVETVMKATRAERLAGEILTPAERGRLSGDVGLAVTLTFSLKEALFKALYPLVGQRFYFEHAEVVHWQADGHARLRLLTDLSEEFCNGAELDGQFSLEGEHLLSLVSVPAAAATGTVHNGLSTAPGS